VEIKMPDKQKKCMLCGMPSVESICESCKSNVQGEAAHKKQKMEKQVKSSSEADIDKRIKKQMDKEK
jgi:hypothetical protein